MAISGGATSAYVTMIDYIVVRNLFLPPLIRLIVPSVTL
jgi:hypothetical protein